MANILRKKISMVIAVAYIAAGVFLINVISVGAAGERVFRITTYELENGFVGGNIHTINLNHNLSSNYFVMVSGAENSTSGRGLNADGVRVYSDPFGNFSAGSTQPDELQIRRESTNTGTVWRGAITVVECLYLCEKRGFILKEVIESSMNAGETTLSEVLSEPHTANTVPFGGIVGGGLTSASANKSEYSISAGLRIYKTGSNTIKIDRGSGNVTPAGIGITTYIVEWGSEWTVQSVNVTGVSFGDGVDDVSEYDSATINQVNSTNTWIWGGGYTNEEHLSSGALGQIIALGDGVNSNATETLVSVGGEGDISASGGRNFQIYVMSNDQLLIRQRYFVVDGNAGPSSGYQEINYAIGTPVHTETYYDVGTLKWTEGFRIPIVRTSSNGYSVEYSRAGAWASRIIDISSRKFIKSWREYAGEPFAAWVSVVDMGNIFVDSNITQKHFRWRNDTENLNNDGGWLAAEDSNGIGVVNPNKAIRLRIYIMNGGADRDVISRDYELQFGEKSGASCDTVTSWIGVEDSSTDAIAMVDSTHITDNEHTTSGLLLNTEGLTWVNGRGVDVSDTALSVTPLKVTEYSEIEYSIEATSNATDGTIYCFRLYDKTDNVEITYDVYPEFKVDEDFLEQSAYRWFANLDSANVGSPLASQDSPATVSSTGENVRLRMTLHNLGATEIITNDLQLKLQYSDMVGSCDADFVGESYVDVGTISSGKEIAYFDNPTPTDGDPLITSSNDPVHGVHYISEQAYEEANNFTNINDAKPGVDMMWDFSLKINATENKSYCIRAVKSDNGILKQYAVIPEIAANIIPDPSISFSISDNAIGFGLLGSSAVRYATGDGLGSSLEVPAHQITVATNASGGYVVTIDGSTLISGNNSIDPIGGTASNVVSGVGTEQFGVRAVVVGGSGGAVSSPYGGGAEMYAFDSLAFPDEIFSGAGDNEADTYDIYYAANASPITDAGNYTSHITYVVTATF